uniref:Uncharacterized protein n=1 Tax=Anopheles quadriannulatus TaxID=34691 RepID=A0A182XRC8_ANOQN
MTAKQQSVYATPQAQVCIYWQRKTVSLWGRSE